MEFELLFDLVLILLLSIPVVFLFNYLKISSIVGFLITGIIVGPYGFSLIKAVHEVEILAEIGVVLLLFTIGIEFSLRQLLQIKRSVLLGGALQVLLTVAAVFGILMLYGMSFERSLFIGFMIALSSTAIVLKTLQDKGRVDSPDGRTVLAILIFQDIIVVAFILLTPLLGGSEISMEEPWWFFLLKLIGLITLMIVGAKWLIPFILYQVTKRRSRELFILTIVGICFTVAWLTSELGLSLALGAFFAGLIISESEYSHQAISNIIPFKEVFTSFFFISIGMLLDVSFLMNHLVAVLIILGIVLFIKLLLAGFAAFSLGFPLRIVILVGLALCQVGEFSFVLAREGIQYKILSDEIFQLFLAVSIITMALTPFIMILSVRLSDKIAKLPLPGLLKNGWYSLTNQKHDLTVKLSDHIIIVGFGVNGRNVARSARLVSIPYIIIEMNPSTVKAEKAKGESIFYGDASQEEVLKHAGVDKARVIVLSIPDPMAVRRIITQTRMINPGVNIIVRTRFITEMNDLSALGADEIIPEELETSVEIFTRVLRKYLVPREEIEQFTREIRSGGYEMLRSPNLPSSSLQDLKSSLPGMDISAFKVLSQSPIVGNTLAELDLRQKYKITLLAIQKGDQLLPNPDSNIRFEAGDVIIILGSPDNISDMACKTGIGKCKAE